MIQLVYFLAAIGALAGALGVVLVRNSFYSVLALVVHLISLAMLFLLLEAQFVAAAQVVVYAGAVMVLYLFVVAYVGGQDQPVHSPGPTLRVAAPLCAVALGIVLCVALLGSGLEAIDSRGAHIGAGYGQPGQIGALLLQKFLLPFEVASFLLLIAAVGAVVLARRRRGLGEEVEAPLHLRRAPGTGTMAEGVSGGVHIQGVRIPGPGDGAAGDRPAETTTGAER